MIELKTFRSIIYDYLSGIGFSKKGGYFYLSTEELTIVIGIQKSSFSSCYYLNIGFILSELNPSLETPRDIDGDIRARFSFEADGKMIDFFNLDKLNLDSLVSILDENCKRFVWGVRTTENIKSLLKKKPVMLYQTKLVAKQFLKLE